MPCYAHGCKFKRKETLKTKFPPSYDEFDSADLRVEYFPVCMLLLTELELTTKRDDTGSNPHFPIHVSHFGLVATTIAPCI